MLELKEIERLPTTEIARRALAEIQAANPDKLLVADEVVSTAAHPDHPLHKCFTWDDTEAAHQWRITEARALIRKITVIPPDAEDESPIPKYVSLRDDRNRKGGGYRETREVVNSKELLSQLEETAKKDIQGVLGRYEMLKALCEKVRTAIDLPPPNEKHQHRQRPKKSQENAA